MKQGAVGDSIEKGWKLSRPFFRQSSTSTMRARAQSCEKLRARIRHSFRRPRLTLREKNGGSQDVMCRSQSGRKQCLRWQHWSLCLLLTDGAIASIAFDGNIGQEQAQ